MEINLSRMPDDRMAETNSSNGAIYLGRKDGLGARLHMHDHAGSRRWWLRSRQGCATAPTFFGLFSQPHIWPVSWPRSGNEGQRSRLELVQLGKTAIVELSQSVHSPHLQHHCHASTSTSHFRMPNDKFDSSSFATIPDAGIYRWKHRFGT